MRNNDYHINLTILNLLFHINIFHYDSHKYFLKIYVNKFLFELFNIYYENINLYKLRKQIISIIDL